MDKRQTKNASKELAFNTEGEYIKNPFTVVGLRGDFSLAQTNVLVTIVSKLQDRIKNYLDGRPNTAPTLFDDRDFDDGNKNILTMDIPLSELCKHACDYADMRKACMALSEVLVPVSKIDKNGNLMESSAQLLQIWTPKNKRVGYVTLQLDRVVVDSVFTMSMGYVTHLKGIVELCKCSRTPHLYMYLSRWFNMKNEYEVPFVELRKLLGADVMGLENDPKTGMKVEVIKERKYPLFRDFKRRILEPVKAELDALLAEHKVDFSFEYEPIYDGMARKAGNPSKVKFTIIGKSTIQLVEEKPADVPEWSSVVEELKTVLIQNDYDVWVKPIVPKSFENNILTLKVPSAFFVEYLEDNLIDKMIPTIIKHFGNNVKLQYSLQ